MSRRSKHEFIASIKAFNPFGLLTRKTPKIPMAPSPIKGPRFKFHWSLDDKGGTVYANTTGEARSQIKSKLGIKGKKRLPIGAELDRYSIR